MGAVLDRDEPEGYPHEGVGLADGVGEYLEQLAREKFRSQRLTVEIAVRAGSPDPRAEEEVRDAIRRYFGSELDAAELELRVNQREGWAVFGWAVLFTLAFIVGAVLLYLLFPNLGSHELFSYLLAGAVIIFVWVLIWDPFEKVTYTAQLMRYRNRALEKLRTATFRFIYAGPPTPGPS